MMIFPLEAISASEDLSSAPHIKEFLRVVHSRPAYKRVSDNRILSSMSWLIIAGVDRHWKKGENMHTLRLSYEIIFHACWTRAEENIIYPDTSQVSHVQCTDHNLGRRMERGVLHYAHPQERFVLCQLLNKYSNVTDFRNGYMLLCLSALIFS